MAPPNGGCEARISEAPSIAKRPGSGSQGAGACSPTCLAGRHMDTADEF